MEDKTILINNNKITSWKQYREQHIIEMKEQQKLEEDAVMEN